MVENRNSCFGNPSSQSRETICIDTYRVMDSCRDRDCYEDARVYLTEAGQEIIATTTAVRAACASILWSYVGVSPVMFNHGFYCITVRTYVRLTLEACVGIGTSQTFYGLVVLEKSVILYGGEGNITSYRSVPGAGYCDYSSQGSYGNNLPVAIVESVPPIVLSLCVRCDNCGCPTDCDPNGNLALGDIPASILEAFDGPLVASGGYTLYASIGIFSVIRIQRPTQVLISAGEYNVPEKECISPKKEDPCCAFRQIPFPTDAFTIDTENGYTPPAENTTCGCRKDKH